MLLKLLSLIILFFILFTGEIRADQYPLISAQCPAGDAKAQAAFLQARQYRFGLNANVDLTAARTLYAKAASLGSAKAFYDLGTMYEQYPLASPGNALQQAYEFYKRAADMGCPEGTYELALWERQKGGGEAEKTYLTLVKKAADGGALVAMFALANIYASEGPTKKDATKALLAKLLDLGYGDAAVQLSDFYFAERDIKTGIDTLRRGGGMGSIPSLYALAYIYRNGDYGQVQDSDYTNCLGNLAQSIAPDAPPTPLEDFDTKCPPRAVIPYMPRPEPGK